MYIARAEKRGGGNQTYFARARILRAPKRGEGGNTSGVFGQVFVRKRKVISHVILLFLRDCHTIAITLSPE